jgi:hypothetical protein
MFRPKMALMCLKFSSYKETAVFAITINDSRSKTTVSLKQLNFRHMMMAILDRNM